MRISGQWLTSLSSEEEEKEEPGDKGGGGEGGGGGGGEGRRIVNKYMLPEKEYRWRLLLVRLQHHIFFSLLEETLQFVWPTTVPLYRLEALPNQPELAHQMTVGTTFAVKQQQEFSPVGKRNGEYRYESPLKQHSHQQQIHHSSEH